ncbi:hypothetical protein EYF80_017154 [Liparis tanakae]|uniref:Uncharacterized protein n=1 Tax=Liparis tanakae TaxID=230148 RepID=A0A4Z2I3J1_9TELE|nr:hypothetical protein EYF80_017154 [Liparis tanakae]
MTSHLRELSETFQSPRAATETMRPASAAEREVHEGILTTERRPVPRVESLGQLTDTRMSDPL